MRLFLIRPIFFVILLLAVFSASANVPVAITQPNALENREGTLQQVSSYLNQFPMIRVGITWAPGNGHQSAGATLITRLRELGFQGEIQVFFDSSVKKQLGYLIPPFDPDGPKNQRFPKKKISFVERTSQYSFEQLAQVELAIMGADDQETRPEDIRADKLLTLQPLDWIGMPSLGMRGKRLSIGLQELGPLGYVFHLPNPQNPIEFIASEMGHIEALAQKIPGLQSIVENLNRLEMVPIYGHRVVGGYQTIAYINGLQYALENEPNLFKGGVVVPLISNFSKEQKQFLEGLIDVRPSLKNIVHIVDVTDSEMKSKCENLKSGEILLVHVGPVSKPVFEYLYQASTLPPVVEGKNSINLMQLIGKPYLPSLRREGFHFSQESEIASDPNNHLARVAFEMFAYESRHDKEEPEERQRTYIGDFILHSKEPNSSMNKLFARFQTSPDAIEKDEVVQGLLIASRTKQFRPPSINQRLRTWFDKLKSNVTGNLLKSRISKFFCDRGMKDL